ncbi:MAG: tetratricopeptide repeat protein [Chloroflexota bacterium]
MVRLELNLLGTFQAVLDGHPLTTFRSDKVRALLAYLAMEGERPQSRDTLANLLWSDYPQDAARTSLRQALSNLRRTLAPLELIAEPLLSITRQDITLAGSHPNIWVDTHRFDTLLGECARHVHQDLTRCSQCIRRLGEASELYRGDFLAGLSLTNSPAFDEWRLLQQESRHQEMLTALNALTLYYSFMGQEERVLKYAHQTLGLIPWHEAAYRQVMNTLVRLKRRHEALAQYEQCRQILADELGVEPEKETVALYEFIKNEEAAAPSSPRLTAAPLVMGLKRAALQYSLPPQATPFIGREQELDHLASLVVDPAYRLVTIVGEGGVGKTRLALATAGRLSHAFTGGVWFVSLTGLSEQSDETIGNILAGAIADTLGFRFRNQNETQDQLFDYLRQKEMLLILDNFEHLLAGVPFVLALWRRAPRLILLLTSRERLNVQAEYTLRLEGLPVPAEAASDAVTYSSLKLFAERADRTPAGFSFSPDNVPDVAQVCRLVEGIPLGIELAAALVEQVSPAEMAGTIRQNLAFLATTMADMPARHRSMHAVFDYSWQLLTLNEQQALAQISIFRGTFDLPAAGSILALIETPAAAPAEGDKSTIHKLLSSAVDKSLLRYLGDGRYEIHQLLRQFTAEKLKTITSDECRVETLQKRHSHYYLSYIGEREAALNGQELPRALADIRQEMDNIRQAWQWAIQHKKLTLIGDSLPALARFYTVASLFQEGEAMLTLALEQVHWWAGDDEARDVYARMLAEQAAFLNALGRYEDAISTAQAAVTAAAHQAGSYSAAAGTLQWGMALWYQGDLTAANPLIEQALSLAQAIRPSSVATQLLVVDSLRAMGSLAYRFGRYAGAREYYEQALALAHDLDDRHGESQALRSLGAVARNLAEYEAAQAYYQQGLIINQELGDRYGQGSTLNSLGDVSYYLGHFSEALTYYEQSLAISRDIGDRRGEAIALNNLGTFYDGMGQYETAQRFHEQALQLKREIGFQRGEGWALDCLGLVYHHQGAPQLAHDYFEQALALFRELGDPIGQGFALTYLGHALAELGRLQKAAVIYREALRIRRTTLGQPHQAMETLAGLARVLLAQGKTGEALAQVEEILGFLAHHSLDGTYERFLIYLTCCRVLAVVGDVRTTSVRQTAQSLLQKQAAGISDTALRRSFLERVAAHQALMEETFDKTMSKNAINGELSVHG